MSAIPKVRFLDRSTPPHIVTLVLIAGLGAMNMSAFLPSLPAMAAFFGTMAVEDHVFTAVLLRTSDAPSELVDEEIAAALRADPTHERAHYAQYQLAMAEVNPFRHPGRAGGVEGGCTGVLIEVGEIMVLVGDGEQRFVFSRDRQV